MGGAGTDDHPLVSGALIGFDLADGPPKLPGETQRCRIVWIRTRNRVSRYHRLHKQMEIRVKSRNMGPKRAAEEHNEERFNLIPTMGTLKLISLLASGMTAALYLRCWIMRQELGHEPLKTGPDSSAQLSLRFITSALLPAPVKPSLV